MESGVGEIGALVAPAVAWRCIVSLPALSLPLVAPVLRHTVTIAEKRLLCIGAGKTGSCQPPNML